MKHRILRTVLVIVGIQVVASIAGILLSRRMTWGDESSDDLQLAAVFGGKKFESEATGLRSASVIAVMGGVELDLRGATLHPDGATLALRAMMGGAQITVPADWAIDVEVGGIAGGVDVDVPEAGDLPEDAPKLHVHAVACMGGGQVTTSTS